MTPPKPKPDAQPASPLKEGGVTQPDSPPAPETGMVDEGASGLRPEPPEGERPGGMIGEG
jgi:hypothetical protein